MKYPKGGSIKRGGKKGSNDRDPFFEQETKERRKVSYDDEDIESIDSDAEENGFHGEDRKGVDEAAEEEEDEFADETAGEKRKRLAEALLLRTREAQRRQREERDDDEDDEDDDIVKTLMKKQQEDSGRVRRAIASR